MTQIEEYLSSLHFDLFTETLGNFLWLALTLLFLWLNYLISRYLQKLIPSTLIKFSTVLILFYISLGVLTHLLVMSNTIILIAGFLGSQIALYYALNRFRKLGIVDGFRSTIEGLDYKWSLRKPKHSFDFLGVGADKLTSLTDFREMVSRCASAGRPVRLLLSPPENPLLRNVATRAGIDRAIYARRVRESLKRIADLHVREGFNIQVRFYSIQSKSDFHQFRLVFIDDRWCIASYTIWDSHEGRSNPQLLLHATDRDPSTIGLYYAFKDYFERIWDDENTVDVDLTRYR